MNKILYHVLWLLLLSAMAACTDEPSLTRMEYIKSFGNHEPDKAIAMLDSMELDARRSSEYVQHKFDLLRIRLKDKALIPQTSDIMIRSLIKFFEDEGTVEDKQEVFYYAGSVYRDLQDTPRALDNFFRSIEYAKEADACDSVMLRNAYSNLCFLQYRVQNYGEAITMARNEQELSQAMGLTDITSLMHIGAAYRAVDNLDQATKAYDQAFRIVERAADKSAYQENAIRLLLDYSVMNQVEKAYVCKSFIADDQPEYLATLRDMAFAFYYETCGKGDSAVYYFKRVTEGNADLNNVYDASKHLYHLYSEGGDIVSAHHHADIFMSLSDSLDFAKHQELAATITNAYKYHLDEKKEQKLIADNLRYWRSLLFSICFFVAFAAVFCVIYFRNRNIHLKKMLKLSSELEQLQDDGMRMREKIERMQKEKITAEESLEKTKEELDNIKQEFSKVINELNDYDIALKDKERQLSEKIEQNKTFIKLLHQSDLEGNAEDIILSIKQSANGKKELKSADWKQIYQAIDELYPTFKDRLLQELGAFTEQQMQVCYLMRIGLTKPQIQNMTNLSRVTIWRWIKKYEWVLSVKDS